MPSSTTTGSVIRATDYNSIASYYNSQELGINLPLVAAGQVITADLWLSMYNQVYAATTAQQRPTSLPDPSQFRPGGGVISATTWGECPPAEFKAEIVISSNTRNFNLYNAITNPALGWVSRAWDASKKVKVTVIVEGGVVVGSNSTSSAAFAVPSFPAGSEITLILNGCIVGRGGDGGKGGNPGRNSNGNPGTKGGPALELRFPTIIRGPGYIGSGGGGGGSGAINIGSSIDYAGGGGGGAGDVPGKRGGTTNSRYDDEYGGGNGELETGGAGGGHINKAGDGGAGGNLGCDGEKGGDFLQIIYAGISIENDAPVVWGEKLWIGGTGGKAGKAIIGSSNAIFEDFSNDIRGEVA